MTRRLSLLTIAVVLLAMPMMVSGATHSFSAAKAIPNAENTVTVPLTITNADNLAAIDLPIRYSDGVVLRSVTFDGTRVEHFDFKAAVINSDESTLILGLLPRMSANGAADLTAGTGAIANLEFEIIDESVESIELEAITLTAPNHAPTFVYHDVDEAGARSLRVETPELVNSVIALSPGSPIIPTEFALAQNYPNPFNPTTMIEFALPSAAHVTLDIFNVLGQKVETLVDEPMEAGSYQREWDGSTAASGVYFYRLTAGNKVQTKKMMMLK